MKRFFYLLAAFFAQPMMLYMSSPCSLAQGISPGVPVESAHATKTNTQIYYEQTIGTVFGFLPVTVEKVKEGAHVAFKVTKDGNLKDIQLSKSSDSFEDNFNVLVGLRDIHRLPPPPSDFESETVALSLINSKAVLASPEEKETLRKANSQARGQFFKSHPDLKGKVVLYNLIPLVVVDKYPEAFSVDEITVPSKLRAIRKKEFAIAGKEPDPRKILTNGTLTSIHDSWHKFFQTHSTATKQELLAQSKLIDQRHKSFFLR